MFLALPTGQEFQHRGAREIIAQFPAPHDGSQTIHFRALTLSEAQTIIEAKHYHIDKIKQIS